MYGGWTEYAVLWTNFLGFIWETGIENSLFWERKYEISHNFFSGKGFIWPLKYVKSMPVTPFKSQLKLQPLLSLP